MQLSRQDIQAVLGLSDLRHTKFYQEAYQEGFQEAYEESLQKGEYRTKLIVVQRLLQMGISLEQITQVVELSLEEVEQMAQKPQ